MNMKKTLKLKETIISFGDSTSMVGVNHVTSSDSMSGRLMWSGICLAATGMLIFMLTQLVLQYLAFPVSVQISQVSSINCYGKIKKKK